MEYNKYRFQKTNDKKILHKVKKHWVVMSMALLMAIGGEAVATHVSAHADVNSNNGQTNDSTNTIKNRLNQQLVQGQQAQNNQSQNAQNNSKQASQINTDMISKQASVLHQRIVNNATATTNSHANLGAASQGRVNGSVNSTNNSAVNNKASQNQTTSVASASAKNSTVPSSAPINHKGSFNSAYQSYEAQMSGTDAKVASANNNEAKNNNQDTTNKLVLKDANPNPINYSDIYHSIDTMSEPTPDSWTGSAYKTPANQAPSDWAFVKADGHISNTPIKNGAGKIMVAPVYKGMTYKYNQAKNTVEFTGGTASKYSNDVNANVNSASEIIFDNGVDLSKVSNSNSILTNDDQLRTLIISSDVKLSNDTSLPHGSWINISSDHPESVGASGNARPGIWTRDAEEVDYILNGQQSVSEGHEIFLGQLNGSVKVGKNPLGLNKGYQVINPQNITINGGRVYVSVEDDLPKKVSTFVDVEYENNHGNTVSDHVLVTLNGNDNNTVYFSPIDVAKPNGYQLDTSRTKSDYAYNINSSNNGNGNWSDNVTPVIYFKGNHDNNDKVLVNQIVETPNGAVLPSYTHSYSVPVSKLVKNGSDNVGDHYTLSTDNVKAPSNYPADTKKDSSVTGEILASSSDKTYLSQPAVTFYYVDSTPDAKRTVNVHYIDQDNDQVGKASDNAYVGSDVFANSYSNVLSGYTVNQPNAKYQINLNSDQDFDVPVTGAPETVNVEYDYKGQQVEGSKDDQITGKRVGDTVQFKDTHFTNLPKGYQLMPSDRTDYQISYADANNVSNGTITYHMKVEPTVKVLPVNFIDQNGNPVGTTSYSVDGQVGQTVPLPDAPKGYTYKDPNQKEKTISQSDITNSSDQFKSTTVPLNGDPESLPVNFVNASDKTVGSTTVSGNSDEIGNTVSLKSLSAPSDYRINPNQNMSYTFTPGQMSDTSGQMKSLNIYVSPTNQHYQLIINANEVPNHKDTKRANTPVAIKHSVDISGPDGKTVTIIPTQYIPNGYTNDPKNQPLTVEITDHGLINANDANKKNPSILQSYSWNYNVTQGSVTVQFIDSSDNQPVQTPDTVYGNVNTNKTVTKYVQPPAGYALDNDVQTNYPITTSNHYYPLYVHSINGSKTPYYQLTFVIETPTGKQVSKYIKGIPITVKENHSQTININKMNKSDFPNSDQADYSPDLNRSTDGGKIPVVNNPSGLTNQGGTFYYSLTSKGIQPINVKYINQNGTQMGSKSIEGANAYYSEPINVTDPSDGGLAVPNGYKLNQGQNVNYTIGDKEQDVTLYIEGDPVVTTAPVQLMHTSKTYHNQNEYLSDVPEVVNLPIRGRVGDPFSISVKDFEGYLPTGYHFAEASDPSIGNTYNGANDMKYIYKGQLTPSDSDGWRSDSWQHSDTKSDSNYWYQQGTSTVPLLVLQASDNKSLNFNIFDTHNQIIDTITIGKGVAKDDRGTIAKLAGYDPAYNDPIDTSVNSPYKNLFPAGYYYDTNYDNPANPSKVRFGENPEDVGIHVAGKLENIHIIYKDHNGNQIGSDYNNDQYLSSDGTPHSVRVGDTVNIPRFNVPKGYQVDSGQPNQYKVNYSDDPASKTGTDDLSGIGNITIGLTVTPNTETLPIKFVDQNNKLIHSDVVSDQIGQSTNLVNDVNSMIPNGYTLNKTDKEDYQNYQFSTDNISSKNQGFMDPVTLHVTGQPATIRVNFVDGSGNSVAHDDINSQVGDVVTMPLTSSDAQQGYGLSSDYDLANPAYNVEVQPSDAGKATPTDANVAVVGKLHDANNLKVNVVYEHANGTKTSDNNVPITVTGRYGSMAHFDPADLALPSGYQFDSGKGKTQASYDVTMDQNDSDAAWDGIKNNPTIYLQGTSASSDVLVNQVIESPAGAIVGKTVSTVHVPVSGKVGDTYTVQANDPKITAPAGTTLATSTEPNGTLNQPLTGKILENEINGTKTVYLSQPADTLYYVDPKATSSITVHYVNQDGNVVGTKPMPKEAVGTSLNMNQLNGNSVPTGYTYDPSNPTTNYYGPSDSTLYLKVDGNPASVNEEYYDGNSDMKISAGTPTGSVGDTVTLATNNLPEGYHLVGNVQDYTFTPSDANASTRHTEKIQLASNQMTLPVNFVDQNGNQVGQTTVQDARDKKQSDTISNVPVGYKLNNNRSDQYNFSKNTPNSSDTMPSDNVKVHAYDGTKINLHFQMPGYNYDVESDLVSGQFGTKLDAMNYMPVGFHLADPSQNTKLVYTFNGDSASAKDNNPVIEVEPDEANIKSINVNLVYQTPDGKQLSSDHVNVPIKTDAQGDFDITPNDPSLGSHITGYTPVKQSDIKGNLIGKLNVTNNIKQTFVYKANPETMPIQFMNQDGNNVGNPEAANGYYGETVNANKLSDFGAKTPDGYTLMNPNATYQFTNGQTRQVVMVNGDTANDKAKITIVENDPYGNKLNSFTTNEPISGQVGDSYDISADQLTPDGYQAVPATSTDPQDLSGQIEAGNKLSNGSATFVYDSTAATTGLKPIYLVYVANDQTIGSSKINPPADPKKTDLYSGKTFNISKSIYAGVPANYSVANGTQTTSSFSAQYPTVLYINVNRAGNKPLTYTANVVQNFYDPYGKLINVKSIPVTESGSLDQIYHISPKNYQVTGYTMKNDNSDTGIITANGLTPSTVVYDYVADSSSAKNSVVKPINVTFKDVDGGKTVGVPQRLDGTMDETINVFDRTTIPSDYHLIANQNPFMTFGTKTQNPTFNVAINQSKIGKVTIMYYDANQPNDLVDQVTAEDPVGTNFALEPYITNVPQNYQFKSMDQNPLINQANGQDPTIMVVNGTRYVTMRVNKIVTNSIVYEDINSDQDPHVRPVSVQQVSGIEGSPIAHARMFSAVPHGYHVVKLGSADPVLNGGKDVVWIRKDAPANSRINVNYVKYSTDGKRLGSDQTAVYGHVGDSFNLADYEQRVPSGYVFANASSTGSMDYFTGTDHTVTINVQQPTHHSNYGKIVVKFVKANDPSQQVGLQVVSTGYNGDVFDVTPYEHNAPEDYNYAGVVGRIPNRYDANNVQRLVIKVK